MQKTNIAWTDYSSNPIRARRKSDGKKGWACVRVSDGCRYCYSDTLNVKFGTGLEYSAQNMDDVEVWLNEKEFAEWRKIPGKARMFPFDMTDVFGKFVPEWMQVRCFEEMIQLPNITFQVLTKRTQEMLNFAQKFPDLLGDNIWLGTSVENQKAADERGPLLLQIPHKHLFYSVEPLLGPIRNLPLIWRRCTRGCAEGQTPRPTNSGDAMLLLAQSVWHGLDHRGFEYIGWNKLGYMFEKKSTYCPTCGFYMPTLREVEWVICGGESGKHLLTAYHEMQEGRDPLIASPRWMDVEWARSIRDQCKNSDTALFYKQGSSYKPGMYHDLDGEVCEQFPDVMSEALKVATYDFRRTIH